MTPLTAHRADLDHPARGAPLPSHRVGLGRPVALELARATLIVAWHSLRADGRAACLLGMSPAVADRVKELSIAEADRFAHRWCRYVRPRWEDRPAVWRQLLIAAQTPDLRAMREVSSRGLQLITGALIDVSQRT